MNASVVAACAAVVVAVVAEGKGWERRIANGNRRENGSGRESQRLRGGAEEGIGDDDVGTCRVRRKSWKLESRKSGSRKCLGKVCHQRRPRKLNAVGAS